MKNSTQELLASLISQHGRAVFENAARCEALLRDLCPQQKKEVSLLVVAIRESIPGDLLASQGSVPMNARLSRLSQRLEANCGLATTAARWAVESWAIALGVIPARVVTRIETPQDPAIADRRSVRDRASFEEPPQFSVSRFEGGASVRSAQAKTFSGIVVFLCLLVVCPSVGGFLLARRAVNSRAQRPDEHSAREESGIAFVNRPLPTVGNVPPSKRPDENQPRQRDRRRPSVQHDHTALETIEDEPNTGRTEVPEVTFFCESINQRVIEGIVREFERTEGVRINMVYDHGSVLGPQIEERFHQEETTGIPDIFMADFDFAGHEDQWFPERIDLSETEIVLVTRKGSQVIKSLYDITKPAVRVGIGAHVSTLGLRTRGFFQRNEILRGFVEKKEKSGVGIVEEHSSALVDEVLSGRIDAAFVFKVDTVANRHRLRMHDFFCPGYDSTVQVICIADESQQKSLARRLVSKIAESQEAFEAAGFDYLPAQDDEPSTPSLTDPYEPPTPPDTQGEPLPTRRSDGSERGQFTGPAATVGQ